MSEKFESAGFTALLLMIHLIQRLVFRNALNREDARELVDLAHIWTPKSEKNADAWR